MSGRGSKTPVVSTIYKWTAGAVAGKNALADDPLKVCWLHRHVANLLLEHPVIGCGEVEIQQEHFPPFTCAKEKELRK